MFCHKCGTQIPDDGMFCPKCGERIATASDETALPLPSADDTTEQSLLPLQKAATAPTYAPIFSITGLFSPNGRRSNSKAFLLGLVTMILFLGMTFFIISTPDNRSNSAKYLFLVFMFLPIVCIYIGATNLTKRLHDIDRTGYWTILWIGLFCLSSITGSMNTRQFSLALAPLIFFIGHLLFAVYITIKPGTVGPNKYGPDPTDKPAEQMDAPPKN